MVLEKLISIREAVRNPWEVFILGSVIAPLCFLLSSLVFRTSIGLFSTFLITFAVTPFMVNLIYYEEAREEEILKRKVKINFLARHKDILLIYTSFFSGVIISLSLIYILLPESIVKVIFEDQINEINLIKARIPFFSTFEKIITNNLGVLIVSYIFSFLFGAGAIFILTWNASILAAAIGITAKSLGGIKALPLAILTFFPHGSLEILAYFIGGIAGGLASASLSRRKKGLVKEMIGDSLILLITASLLLVIAAFIESSAIVL